MIITSREQPKGVKPINYIACTQKSDADFLCTSPAQRPLEMCYQSVCYRYVHWDFDFLLICIKHVLHNQRKTYMKES